jgi:O-antigen/teichoic acid export membrane protein
MRAGILLQAGIAAAVVVWATPIVHLLLDARFAPSADVLRLLGPLVFLTGIGALTSMSVNYLGEARRRVPIAIGTALVNAAIDLVLLPRIGVIGAAIGTDIAYTLYVIGHLWICTTLLDLDLSGLALTLVRAMFASVVMGAVLALFGTRTLSPLEWVAGVATGIVVYGVVLLLTRELTMKDLSAAKAVLRGLRQRGDVNQAPGPV